MIERFYFYSIIFSQKMGSEKHMADVVVPGHQLGVTYKKYRSNIQKIPGNQLGVTHKNTLRLAESDFCAESEREHQNQLALCLIDVDP